MKALASWETWVAGGVSGLTAAVSTYWHSAPHAMQIAAECYGPLFLMEAITASAMQWLARRQDRWLEDGEDPVEVYPGDTWMRAGERCGIMLGLCCLAAMLDAIAGTPHSLALFALLWCVIGHARATYRHLHMIAAMRHFEMPNLPLNQLDPPHRGHEVRRRRRSEP